MQIEMTDMIFKHRYRLCAILAAAIVSFWAYVNSNAAKVELQVETPRSGVIGEGDSFYIYITVSDIQEAPVAPKSVPGATVLYFGHRSSQSSFVSANGRTSQSFTNVYALTLRADKKGKYSFGPITVGGVKSNAVSYSIGSPMPAQSQQQAGGASNTHDPQSLNTPSFIGKGNEQLFLRANVSKTTAYEQEALVYTVKLYTTYNSIKFIGATDAPKFDNFVIEESGDISNQLSYETYQGKTYATAVIAKYIIFPQMAGKLKVIGNKYTVSADAEEYYHDPYFSTLTVRKPVQLHVTPNDLTIDVKALPSPRPADFSGGVGQFTISSSLASPNAVAHQAGSITYTVRGSGNLKYIALPDLNKLYPEQLEVFTPVADINTHVGSNTVAGSVKFDYSFMPLESGNFQIPAVTLVYFNPVSGQYERAEARGYSLHVAKGVESEKSQAAMTFDGQLMPIGDNLSKYHRPYVMGFAYWLWYILPTLLLVAALLLYRKRLSDMSDLVALRSKRAAKIAKRRLKRAELCMHNGNSEAFYTEMLKALWGYMGDKLKLPTSELNRANVSGLLEARGVSDEITQRLLDLLDKCEYAKYASGSSEADLTEIYDEATAIIKLLEDAFRVKVSIAPDDNASQSVDEKIENVLSENQDNK